MIIRVLSGAIIAGPPLPTIAGGTGANIIRARPVARAVCGDFIPTLHMIVFIAIFPAVSPAVCPPVANPAISVNTEA